MIGMPTPKTWPSPWKRLTWTGWAGGAGLDDVFEGAAEVVVAPVEALFDEPAVVGAVLVAVPAFHAIAASGSASATSRSRWLITWVMPSPRMLTPYSASAISMVRFWCV